MSTVPTGNGKQMGVAAYLLFFVTSLAFGYAAPGFFKWLAVLFPLALALGAMSRDGFEGTTLARLAVALLVTAGGILLGWVIDERSASRDASAA